MIQDRIRKKLLVKPGKRVKLSEFITGWEAGGELSEAGKDLARERDADLLETSRASLSKAQELFGRVTPGRCL